MRREIFLDGPVQLGTGGALRAALPLLPRQFFVLYGDSYLPIEFSRVWRAFHEAGRPALMTVLRNEDHWDASNVVFADGLVRCYDKRRRRPDMRHIDYGLGVIDAAVISVAPTSHAWDLADLYRDLAERRLLAGHEVAERFHEIGSPAGLADTEAHLRAMQGANRLAEARG